MKRNGDISMKALKHLQTINHHKLLVMKHCFKVGLYKQGLLHDLSKYSPTEFLVGCRYYQGTRSPNNAEREATGYSTAWLHHKGRNKHHYEYWIDYSMCMRCLWTGSQHPKLIWVISIQTKSRFSIMRKVRRSLARWSIRRQRHLYISFWRCWQKKVSVQHSSM